MTLKAKIKRAFGYGDNPQKKIMDFLLKKNLPAAKMIVPDGSDCLKSVNIGEKNIYCGKKEPI